MYAIPTPGRSVPIPGTRQLLPSTGKNIGPLTQYWLRRLRDGDITVQPNAQVSEARFAAAQAQADSFTFHVATPEPAPPPVLGPTLTTAPPYTSAPDFGSAPNAPLGGTP